MSSTPPSEPTPPSPGKLGDVVPLVPAPGHLGGGRYALCERVSWGGQGVVYRGVDTQLGRQVAIKLLHRPVTPMALGRLEAAARVTGPLRHPNLLQVLAWDPGQPGNPKAPAYLVTEWVSGPSLDEYLKTHGPIPPEVVAMIGWLIGGPLEVLHLAGVVHRDLKPSNVLIDRQPTATRLVLADYGVVHWPFGNQARGEPLTAPGERVGTVPYMSPEQALGEHVDPRSDLFSLASLLHELLTGHRPFDGPDEDSIVAALCSGPRPALDVPRLPQYLRSALEQMFQAQATARPADLHTVRRALRIGLHGEELREIPELVATYLNRPAEFTQALDVRLVQIAELAALSTLQETVPPAKRLQWADLCRRALIIAPGHTAIQKAYEILASTGASEGAGAGAATSEDADDAAAPAVVTRGESAGATRAREDVEGEDREAVTQEPPAQERVAAVAPGTEKTATAARTKPPRRQRPERLWQGVAAALALVVLSLAFDVPKRLKAWSKEEPAEWAQAQVLGQRSLTGTAAKYYELAAARSEALRPEASHRASDLRAADEQTKALEQVVLDAEAAGEPIPRELAAKHPGHVRRAFHNALRSATTAAQVQALLPLAKALDQQCRCDLHERYVGRVAAMDFAVRAPLAKTYAQLVADYDALSRPEQDRYFEALRRAGQKDLLLGALVLTDRVSEDPAEYVQLAAETADPWFIVYGMQLRAMHALQQGQDREAKDLLVKARAACEREHLAYRCIRIDAKLAYLHRLRHDVRNAEGYARRGWELARQTKEWQVQTMFITELAYIARLRGDTAQVEMYFQELRERDPANCEQQQQLYVQRAHSALEARHFDDARREIAQAPRCGALMSVEKLSIEAQLDRVRQPVIDWQQLRAEFATRRAQPGLPPGEQALLLRYEGLFVITHDRMDGIALLQAAVSAADALPSWDVNARNARIEAAEELALYWGQAKDFAAALHPIAQSVGVAVIPKCSLAAVRSYERMLVLVHGAAGRVRGTYLPDYEGLSDRRSIVSSELQAELEGCEWVEIFSSLNLRGKPDLLPPELAWAYRGPRKAALPPLGNALSILEADDTESLGGADIAQRELTGWPFVIWHKPPTAGAASTDPLHDPFRDVPSAYLEANGRGVLAIGSEVNQAQARELVRRVFVRVQAGEAFPVAVRNERMSWLKHSPWVKNIVPYQ